MAIEIRLHCQVLGRHALFDFIIARTMPVHVGLFPAAQRRGFRNIYYWGGRRNRHHPSTGNHPAVSRNEAIATAALPPVSTILASLGQATFAWDIATDATIWSECDRGLPGYPGGGMASGAEFSTLIEPARSTHARERRSVGFAETTCGEESHSSFFGSLDIRSSRSCISFI
jgi:hypothetical protein